MNTVTDETGILTAVSLAEIPFEVKRVFVVNGMGKRGGHGHKECDQYLVCTMDKVWVNGSEILTGVGMKLWRGTIYNIDFGTGASILVFCSHEYDPNDYIYP